ncbi:MAG: hypothetical protein ACPGTU_17375 [Myxococcota bacterium]
MFRLLPILVLTACFGDARKEATVAYANQMQELMLENDDIGREFLDTALRIKKKELMPKDVAERLSKRIVPRAKKLAANVSAVQPETPSLKNVHVGIVRAWTNRADAYERMHSAWVAGDLAEYSRALEDNKTVRKAEDRYLESTNQLLVPYEMKLDITP